MFGHLTGEGNKEKFSGPSGCTKEDVCFLGWGWIVQCWKKPEYVWFVMCHWVLSWFEIQGEAVP